MFDRVLNTSMICSCGYIIKEGNKETWSKITECVSLMMIITPTFSKPIIFLVSKSMQKIKAVARRYSLKLPLMSCNFVEKRLERSCFPMSFAKFLKTPFLHNIRKLLLLQKVRNYLKRFHLIILCKYLKGGKNGTWGFKCLSSLGKLNHNEKSPNSLELFSEQRKQKLSKTHRETPLPESPF